jgi:hypothetical protein
MNIIFLFGNYIIFYHPLQYCDMCSEIIQSVAYDNYDDDFQHVNFIFWQNQIFFFIISLSLVLCNNIEPK